MRFRPEQHLRRQRDFAAVREGGRRLACGAFNFSWLLRTPAPAAGPESSALPTAPAPARVGVVASAAAVGGAVERNRAKRRLREIFRRHQALVPPGCDLVLTARSAIARTAFAALEDKFVAACRQLPPGGTK